MRRFLTLTSVCLMSVLVSCSTANNTVTKGDGKAPAPNAPIPPPVLSADAKVTLSTDDEKTIYALGLLMTRQMEPFALTASEIEIVRRALSDSQAGKPAVDIEVFGPRIDGLLKQRQGAIAGKSKDEGKAFADKAATEKGAERTASGMVYRSIKEGSGASPKATDTVSVHYKGTLTDGKEFDSSYSRNMPAEFPLNGVIPCWTEGVQKMKLGGKAQLVCPSEIAYGDQGRPPTIPGGATLVFEVELLAVK
jgi:FKBP-type peptidyl-prolyl cis-trans isomerase FkpA